MFRTGFVLAFHLILILIMYTLAGSTISKRLQKCRAYNVQVYGQPVPSCETSIGSRPAIKIEEFPHIAVFGHSFFSNEEHDYLWYYNGALVSSRYVLSSGHCLKNLRAMDTKVRLGATSYDYTDESKSTDYDVEQFILHPNFTSSSSNNDIGIAKLSRKVKFSERVRPICLPDTDLYSDRIYKVNYEPTEQDILTDSFKTLTKYELTSVTNGKCNEIFMKYLTGPRKLRDGITESLMCAIKTLPNSRYYNCAGESGDPLYIDHPEVTCSHVHLGIVSFGIGCDSDFPESATKVYNFADWIESVIWADGKDF